MESTFNLSVLDVSVSKADCEARHIAGGILQREQRLILRSKLKHHAAEAGGIAESFWPRSTFSTWIFGRNVIGPTPPPASPVTDDVNHDPVDQI